MIQIQIKPIIEMTTELLESKARKAKEAVLRRSGAISRGIMRRLIRRGKRKSEPGQPPISHVAKGGIKNLIAWGYDKRTGTVVVGPMRDSSISNINPVPGTLDQGGKSLIRVDDGKGKGKRRRVMAMVRARPFTGEALRRFAEGYPDLWKDAIK